MDISTSLESKEDRGFMCHWPLLKCLKKRPAAIFSQICAD